VKKEARSLKASVHCPQKDIKEEKLLSTDSLPRHLWGTLYDLILATEFDLTKMTSHLLACPETTLTCGAIAVHVLPLVAALLKLRLQPRYLDAGGLSRRELVGTEFI
jgi:hypothetical protein